MKKFLLSLALCAGLTATAETVTFDFVNEDYGLTRLSGTTTEYIAEGTSITHEGVTLTFNSSYGEESKNESGCRLWSTGFRMYNGGVITVTADQNISNVVIDPEVSTIEINEGDNAWTLAYTATSKNGQFTSLSVTLGEAEVEDGTAEHPYQIATAEDLCNAYKLVDNSGCDVYFVQTADIDMAGVKEYHAIAGYNGVYAAVIHYDGQNHLIKNFAPDNVAWANVAETDFYYCTSVFGVASGEISNLGVINAKCVTDHGAGILAGYAGHSSGAPLILENVFVTGEVVGTGGYTGGFFGTTGNEITMTDCFANVTVSGTKFPAGLIGRASNNINLERVYVAGEVSGPDAYLVMGTNKTPVYNGYEVIAFNTGAEAAVSGDFEIEDEEVTVATPETEAELIEAVKEWKGFSATKMVYGLPGLDAFAYEVFRLPVVKSVKETIALNAKDNITVGYELTVGFVNNNNVFACDAAGDFIQLYGKNTLKVGDVIPAGWSATYDLYNGTPELINFGTLPEVTEGTFEAKAVAAADITTDLVNSVVVVKDVVFAEATPAARANFTGTVGDVELSFRNNYQLESVEAGTYDVTLVVTIFNGAPSLYVIKYTPSETTGISAIEAETAAPVYYNLQGVEVANPENGVYIVRRGNKVTKEIIR